MFSATGTFIKPTPRRIFRKIPFGVLRGFAEYAVHASTDREDAFLKLWLTIVSMSSFFSAAATSVNVARVRGCLGGHVHDEAGRAEMSKVPIFLARLSTSVLFIPANGLSMVTFDKASVSMWRFLKVWLACSPIISPVTIASTPSLSAIFSEILYIVLLQSTQVRFRGHFSKICVKLAP